jgi:hypothetical protein
MKRLLLALCVLCMIFAATTCFAGTVNGVLAEERVINLPNDQGKWYISVVGDAKDAQYQTIMKWFGQDPALRKLKSQVRFCPVTSNTTVYKTRYSMNVEGLPTVRLQNNQGVVIYEAAGKNLPFTAEGLYGAMANSVATVQCRPILPWRRNHVHPCPCPQPDPDPVAPDPEPQPIDDGEEPEFEPVQSSLPPLWLMLTVLVASAGAGLFVEWRATYAEK